MYALYLYRRVIFGPLEKASLQAISDMNAREIAILAPLVAGTLLFGIWPAPALRMTEASIDNLITAYRADLERHAAKLSGTLQSDGN
jgi:NADH-quinone oxidoreductase subunit M